MKAYKFLPLILMISIFGILATSCSKDPGFGGQNKIYGTVSNTDGAVQGAIVHIKFDATSATTTSDFSTVSEANGSYMFDGLTKADYVIWAEYTDSEGFYFMSAGTHVTVNGKKNETQVDLTLD
jgi:hypothetical protein